MGLFGNYNKEGKGVSKNEEKKSFPVRYIKVFTSRFWQLVVLNLMYVFACLPIITIGPATAGFTYVLRNYSEGKPVYLFSDFMEKCKENFKQGLFVFLLDAVLIFMMVFAYFSWSTPSFWMVNETTSLIPDWLRPAALVFVFVLLYIFISANFYIYPMMVSFRLTMKQLIRNSIILGVYKIGKNLLMILFTLAVFLILLATFPPSLAFAVLLPFSVCGLFTTMITFPELVKHVAVLSEEPEKPEEEPVFKDIH